MKQMSEEERISEELIRAFRQFGRLHMADVGKARDPEHTHHGLRRSEVMLLLSLNEKEGEYPEGISVSDIGRLLYVKPPSITPVITGLEQKGLIERTMDISDRRIVRVKMTETGQQFIDRRKQCMVGQIKGLVEYLGNEKSAALAGLINETFYYFKSHSEQNKQP